MMKSNQILVVCDSQRAQFYNFSQAHNHLNLTYITGIEQDNPPSRDQGTDKPGIVFSRAHGSGSYVAERDYHTQTSELFAQSIINIAHTMRKNNKIEGIGWIAPPRMLSMLRLHRPHELSDITFVEINKDLTKHPKDELIKHLKHYLIRNT